MKIGIIGASSQVGSSVAIDLKRHGNAEVICYTRSTYSHVYFEMFGISVEQIDYTNKKDTIAKFKDLTVLVDFSYPTGQLLQIKKSLSENLEFIISCLPTSTTFIYMSSIMAYGMAPTELYVRKAAFPASSYAYFKRYAEKIVLHLGIKNKVRVYNFRLGQVHGTLQSVTRSFKHKLGRNETVYVYGKPSDLTNVIFPSAIAESIVSCTLNKYSPGTYTLVASPQWKLRELYTFYFDYFGCQPSLVFMPLEKKGVSLFHTVLKFLSRYRLQLETYVLMRLPRLAIRVKGRYRVAEVANTVLRSKANFKDTDLNLLGEPSLKILMTSNSTIESVTNSEREFETFYNQTILANRV